MSAQEFDFDKFEQSFLNNYPAHTMAISSLLHVARTNVPAERFVSKYFEALADNEIKLNDLVVRIVADHDAGYKEEATRLLTALVSDERLKPHFRDRYNEQRLFVRTEGFSPEAKHMLMIAAEFAPTTLLTDKAEKPSSWIQSMISNCGEDAASCDFVLSKTFEAFNTMNFGDTFFRDNVFRAIEQAGSVALKGNYVHLLKWMEEKELDSAYTAHIPQHWHTFKNRAHDNDCAELSAYLSALAKKKAITPRYIEDEIDADEVMPVAVISAFEKGMRCKSDVPKQDILHHMINDNRYYLYALVAQKICAKNEFIDFRSAYQSLDANKMTSEMMGRFILESLSINDMKEMSIWEDRLATECKQKVEKGKSNFFKALLIAFPGVEVFKFAIKVSAGEQYNLVDGVSSAAMLSAWLAAVCFTEEGKSALKFLSTSSKEITDLIVQKAQDIVHAIATKAEKGLESLCSGFLKLIGRQIEPDVASDLEVLPMSKQMIRKLDEQNRLDHGPRR